MSFPVKLHSFPTFNIQKWLEENIGECLKRPSILTGVGFYGKGWRVDYNDVYQEEVRMSFRNWYVEFENEKDVLK